MKLHNPNLGKSQFDPDYRDDYNQEADLDAYNEACEEKEEQKKYSHDARRNARL